MLVSNRSLSGLGLLLLALSAHGVEAQTPTGPIEGLSGAASARGVALDRSFDAGLIEQVNRFNGNLSLQVPIGQRYSVNGRLSYGLALSYNAQVWDWDVVDDPMDPENTLIFAYPSVNEKGNAGLGWTLSMGQLLIETPVGNPEIATYVSEDGGRHKFFATLHVGDLDDAGDTSSTQTVQYTRDSTYLRLKVISADERLIEFPDGMTRTFERTGGGAGEYFLTRIEDRYGNFVAIAYTPSILNWNLWTITDSHSRSHEVEFTTTTSAEFPRVPTRVKLEQFGGGDPAEWVLAYGTEDLQRPCPNQVPNSLLLDVPLLATITQPDGSVFDADYYLPDPPVGNCHDKPGFAKTLTLPTLGKIGWDFGGYTFPARRTNENPPPQPQLTDWKQGVVSRTEQDRNDTVLGTWTYSQELGAECGDSLVDSITTVTDPLGHYTKHYFTVVLQGELPPAHCEATPREFGLPYSPRTGLADPVSGLFLSSETFDDQDTLYRSEYTLYERDEWDSLDGFADQQQTNRRPQETRTVYHLDGDRFGGSTSTDFDGVGHYRSAATNGNFNSGNVRSTATDFNSGLGRYEIDPVTNTPTGNHTFVMLLASEPWILGTFGEQTVTESGDTAHTTSCFDDDGFLTRRRFLVGASEGSNDVLSVFVPNGEGNVSFERSYGGDTQSINTGGNLCNLNLPSSPAYEMEHQYSFGSRRLSRYRDGGTPIGWNSFEATVDSSTGLVASSKDTAGIETTYDYDALGRTVAEEHETGHGAWVEYDYVPAAGSGKARVDVKRRTNGGGTLLQETQVVFDDLGRVFQEKTELPSGAFGVRETQYNERGDRSSVSEIELGSPSNKTEFLNYDPFGRPGIVRPADGSAHDVTVAYTGVRQVARTSKYFPDSGGAELDATFTEIYDRQGRLYQTIEPGAETTTTHGYDVGNRLSSVSMDAPDANLLGNQVIQTRAFVYDHLGFLRSETQPELGNDPGNGTVNYSMYDARGRVGRMVDDRRTLDYAYDAAERLTTVSSPGVGTLKAFTYDTATTNGLGKVHTATRTNRREIPGDGTSSFIDVMVTEAFDYNEIGGRISEVRTTNSFNTMEFVTSQSYDDLGRVLDLLYPSCEVAPECPNDPLTVSHGYEAGYLTDVGTPSDPSAFAALTYHPNGLWSTIDHGNGVTTTQLNDPNSMRRPQQLFISGLDPEDETLPFDTGLYAYDGSGNIKAMGNDTFEYDALSRVVDSMLHEDSPGQFWEQEFTYDDFGNIELIRTKPPGGTFSSLNPTVTTSTNRLTNSTYDGSGNLIDFDGAWEQNYDLLNMAAARNPADDASQWVAIYTASDERLAVWDTSSGEQRQHWTLRSPSGQVLREFRYAPSMPGDLIFADGFESGDTSAWDSVTGLAGGATGGTGVPVPVVIVPTWTVKTSYIYRGGSLLADYLGGDARHYHLDHLGSVRQITNEDAFVAETRDYLPYGEELNSSTGALQFTGHERDTHLAGDTDDLDHMHARSCIPFLGRFVNVDPKARRMASKAPQRWNRYSYARNNPIRLVDPDGREEVTFQFSTAINQPTVSAEPFGTFAGGVKTFQQVTVETDRSIAGDTPIVRQSKFVGETQRLSPPPLAVKQASSQGVGASASFDARGNVVLMINVDATNPFIPSGPSINTSMTVTLDPSGESFAVSATTDGFPTTAAAAISADGVQVPIFLDKEGSSPLLLLPVLGDENLNYSCTFRDGCDPQ